MTNFRIDVDSMGELKVPEDALYGAHTQRAVNNFPISGQRMPVQFIESIIHIKSSASATNKALKLIPPNVADAIVMACNDLLNREDLLTHFPVDIFQTGSGTSSNMNVNEVVANLATKLTDEVIDPNDHVNYGQSSNDVIPSAIHISAALLLDKKLLPALEHLSQTIEKKQKVLSILLKLDAPI
jgi:fumarate hydratase class II